MTVNGTNFTFYSFDLSSGGALTLSSAMLNGPATGTTSGSMSPQINMNVAADATISGSSIINTVSGMNVYADGNLNLTSSIITGGASSNSAPVLLQSGVDMNVTNSTITGYDVQLTAGRNLNMSGATTFAGNPGNIRMQATKIFLVGVNFPGSANVQLYTSSGNWSTSTPLPDNAFLSGCSYGGASIPAGSGGPGTTIATSGPNTMQSLKSP